MKDSRYAEAGVDISAKAAALARAKSAIRSTFTPRVLGDIGGFGGLYCPDFSAYREPVLVASTDGVGTKLKVAMAAARHDTCGADLVNHCVNDILVQGAKPLFFLDYIAAGKIEPEVLQAVIEGIARGCRENGTALLGGETAEMPGFYAPGDYDVAGTIVGVVEREKILDGSRVRAGDVVLGLPSAGLHTNGYTLARKVFFEELGKKPHDRMPDLGSTVADALLAPHLSYLKALEPLLAEDLVHAMAHITGGGFYDNIPRVLPEGVDVVIKSGTWPVLPVFAVIEKEGNVSFEEMHRVFNMGIGMVVFVAPSDLQRVAKIWSEAGQTWYAIGNVKAGGNRRVAIEREPGPRAWLGMTTAGSRHRLAILLSGRGSNFEAIAEAVADGRIPDAEIIAVLSDVPEAAGLERARKRGLPAFAVDRGRFGNRREYEAELLGILDEAKPDLICLAGYMRVLSPDFVARYRGRILNIHPALLPKFRGLHAQRQALDAGETVSGCTVHFVDEGTDTGPVILQRTVPVMPGDSEESLSERILVEEHRAYPEAIAGVLSGRFPRP